jgi:hypothetical protein
VHRVQSYALKLELPTPPNNRNFKADSYAVIGLLYARVGDDQLDCVALHTSSPSARGAYSSSAISMSPPTSSCTKQVQFKATVLHSQLEEH